MQKEVQKWVKSDVFGLVFEAVSDGLSGVAMGRKWVSYGVQKEVQK